MFIEALIEYLEANGVGSFGVDLFGSEYPSTAPDVCVLVRGSGGPPPSKYVPVREYLVQFLSRGLGYPQAEAKAWQIFELFHGEVENQLWKSKHNYKIGDYHVFASQALQTPMDISPDEKGRSEASLNIRFKIRLKGA